VIIGKGNRTAQRKRYKLKHPDKVKSEKARYRKAHPEKARDYMKRKNKEWRVVVLNHYSNGLLKCAACGENHIEFLEIDHINGGGNKHKRDLGNKGSRFING
jgi:hypothetical protein